MRVKVYLLSGTSINPRTTLGENRLKDTSDVTTVTFYLQYRESNRQSQTLEKLKLLPNFWYFLMTLK